MKNLLKAAVVAALVAVCSIASAQSFGFTRGMTPQQVISQLGKDAVVQTADLSGMGEKIMVNRAPSQPAGFSDFVLYFSNKDGLLKVVGNTAGIATFGSGYELNSRYNSLLDQLAATYGPPTKSFNFLESGSVWKDPGDFMRGLLKSERHLDAYWLNETALSAKGYESMAIRAYALRNDKGWVSVAYELDGWSVFSDAVTQKDPSAI
jgi:hypothetical protein